MKRSFKIIALLAIILALAMAVILQVAERKKTSGKVSIVTTNFPAYDFARAVAGETADVKMLVKPGAEVHDFEPTPGDIIEIEKSALFIYNGGESEGWVEGILAKNEAGVTTLKMMDAVETVTEETVEGMEDFLEGEDDETEEDEHIWTSVRNAAKIVEKIRDKLSEISPENRELFRENTQKYTAQLEKLDAEFTEVVKNGRRKVLVFGDRFPLRYFVDDYGLGYFAAFPGCSEQTEASGETVAFLTEKIRAEKIPVVLKIEMSSGEIAETIAEETGAKVLTFSAAHNVSAEDFRNGKTYVEMMTENIKVLKEALK